jgi:hypothetical protein
MHRNWTRRDFVRNGPGAQDGAKRTGQEGWNGGGGQSSSLSEKALFRMETQLKSTTEMQPMRPAKNMTSSTFFPQNIQ